MDAKLGLILVFWPRWSHTPRLFPKIVSQDIETEGDRSLMRPIQASKWSKFRGFSCETLVATASHKLTQLLVAGSQNNSEKTILAPVSVPSNRPTHRTKGLFGPTLTGI